MKLARNHYKKACAAVGCERHDEEGYAMVPGVFKNRVTRGEFVCAMYNSKYPQFCAWGANRLRDQQEGR